MKILIFVLIASIFFSCGNNDSNGSSLTTIQINAPNDSFYDDVQYYLVESLTYSNEFGQFNLNNLTVLLNEHFDINSIDFSALLDLGPTIEVDFRNRPNLYLILLKSGSIADYFELNSSNTAVQLKSISYFSTTNQLQSNSINVIDTSVVNLNGINESNMTIYFDSNTSLTLTNSTLNNTLINLNFLNTTISFDNITISNAKIINPSSTINLTGNININDSHIERMLNTNFLFSINAGTLELKRTFVRSIPNFISSVNSENLLENTYFTQINSIVLRSNTNSRFTVKNSFFNDNNTCFETLNADSLIVENSIISNNNLVMDNVQTNVRINNSHIAASGGKFIEQDYDFNLVKAGTTTISTSNIIFNLNGFIIEMKDGVRHTDDISILSSFIDFNTADIDSKIRDGNDAGTNVGAEVIISNSLSELISSVGIQ